MATQQTTTEFYKEKGKVRYTLILDEKAKDKLLNVAKTYRITQGEVLEVLLNQLNLGLMGQHFEAKRLAKDDGKTSKTELSKMMRDATPEQLAAIQAILGGKQ